jgi:hypothetical protein
MMPQTTVLPQYRADYPILAKVQKPGGVTTSTVLIASAVPNKPTYASGTIQMVQAEVEEDRARVLRTEDESEEESEEEAEDTPDPSPRRGRRR